MSEFVSVGRASDFAEGDMRMFKVGPEEVVVARVAGKFYAFGNYCAHVGAPLVEGYIDDCAIICAYHRWAFNLETGKEVYGGAPIPVFTVKVEGDEVLVESPDRDPDWRPPHLRFVSMRD